MDRRVSLCKQIRSRRTWLSEPGLSPQTHRLPPLSDLLSRMYLMQQHIGPLMQVSNIRISLTPFLGRLNLFSPSRGGLFQLVAGVYGPPDSAKGETCGRTQGV